MGDSNNTPQPECVLSHDQTFFTLEMLILSQSKGSVDLNTQPRLWDIIRIETLKSLVIPPGIQALCNELW